MAQQITYPNKVPGNLYDSSEANEVKQVVNANALELEQVNQFDTVLEATSINAQIPSAPGVPLQVEFGAAQGGPADPVELAADGTMTFNQAGVYEFSVIVSVQRVKKGGGEAIVFFRAMKNGVQEGNALGLILADADETTAGQAILPNIPIDVGDVGWVEMARDEDGNDSGQLVGPIPTGAIAGWGPAPSASLRIIRSRSI